MPSTRPHRLRRPAAALALAGLAAHACAQGTPDEPSPSPNGKQTSALWEAGLFGVTSYAGAYPGSNQSIPTYLALPYALYRGPVFRVADGGVGVRAYKTPRVEWVVSATGAFGGAANQVQARSGMPSIGFLVEFGPALKINLGDLLDASRDPRKTRLDLPVRGVFDVSHEFSHEGWSFEPRLSHALWNDDTFSLGATASLLVGDRALNHLFYGVDPVYATPDRPAYVAKAGLIATRFGLNLTQRVSDNVRLHWFATMESVRGAANVASPLVRAHEDGGFGVSLTWSLWRSDQPGVE